MVLSKQVIMELPWNDPISQKFVTQVGLVTSEGIDGPNIMACKWNHHISYNPGLIAISLGLRKAIVKNIRNTREFGINLLLHRPINTFKYRRRIQWKQL